MSALRTLIVLALIPVGNFAMEGEEQTQCPDGKKQYRTTLRHIESGGIGYKDGYTTLEFFFASDPSQWAVTPFFDLRGHVFDNGKGAANVGVGLRTLFDERAYGINSYYDYRKTSQLNSNQIGFGFETLGEWIDCRINAYFPFGKTLSSPYGLSFANFSGNSLLMSEKYQSAMKGANAELGFHFGHTDSFDFYGAIGPYFFAGKKAPDTWGGKVRIAGTYKGILALEISDSYDGTFRNNFQGEISLNYAFGPRSKVNSQKHPCSLATTLNDRMLQPVERQEIIVIDRVKKKARAINPSTGLPYFFTFVDNTSSSAGTYESPYPTFAQAELNSSPNDVIYVFPGDGTTAGMNSGLTLKSNQKLWGSGVEHLLETTLGTLSIPAQTNRSPIITNTNVDTLGHAVILATNNEVSGFTIQSALVDGIYGEDPLAINVSSCIFENTATFPIEIISSTPLSASFTNNQFSDNDNGISCTSDDTATIVCSNNLFEGQTSVSAVPIDIAASGATLLLTVENNTIRNNETGSIRVGLTNVLDAEIAVLKNVITGNGTGFSTSLASSCVILTTGTVEQCALTVQNNQFSDNASNALYFHTDGQFSNLNIVLSSNTVSEIGGSALALATPVETLTLLANENTISNCVDNGISVISAGVSSTGLITIDQNTITDIGNMSNGIAINQNFTNLDLTISNNEIHRCEGSGFLSYASGGIDSFTATFSNNSISDCENLGSNTASALTIEQYTTLTATITNNTLSENSGLPFNIASALTSPTTCLTLSGNQNDGEYLLSNPMDGLFNLAPCNPSSLNTGTINTSGTINAITSCPDGTPCPP